MALPAPREIIRTAKAHGLDTDLPAIAVQFRLADGVDPNSDEALQTPCAYLEPIPHPVLAAFLETSNAARRGRMSWSMGMGDDFSATPLNHLRDRLSAGLLQVETKTVTARGPRDMHDIGYNYPSNDLEALFRGSKAARVFANNREITTKLNTAFPTDHKGFGGVSLACDGRVTWIKVFTHKLEVPEWLPQVNLNLAAAGKSFVNPKPILVTHAIAVLEWLRSEGVTTVDPTLFDAPAGEGGVLAMLRRKVASSVIAYPTPGRPALAEVSVGSKVAALVPTLKVRKAESAEAATRGTVRAEDLAADLRRTKLVDAVIHRSTIDMGHIAIAEPFVDDRLRTYQQDAVGRHVASTVGFVNSCSPGMGKTVMTAVGMQQRALARPGYRALVVTEANVRTQWVSELTEWFPEAKLVKISKGSDGPLLNAALDDAGEEPLVVVMSYSLLKTALDEHNARLAEIEALQQAEIQAGIEALEDEANPAQDSLFSMIKNMVLAPEAEVVEEVVEAPVEPVEVAPVEPAAPTLGMQLLDTFWHDLIADEAEVLRSTGRQAAALWVLRANSEVALALTGTPINRGVDDLGRLIAWTRGDENLFYGMKLSTQFDLTNTDSLKDLAASMGAALFRRDTSEVEDELPTIVPVVMKLKPSPAEKALASAARAELKRVYDELVAAVEHAESLDPSNPAFAEAREILKGARGAWLGGTTLARMASSDPAALLGSTSAGAALLAGQGLIEAATQVTGTKRAAVVADVTKRVSNGEAVLVFTEFATVAVGIIADLEAAGVKVGAVLGGGGVKRDRMIEEFQTGDIDVLVCTSSGERGLNLQRATTLVHYDLPWTPKGVIQRTGRARRLKSENNILNIVFPLMEGTIEEDVASMVVTRAVEAMQTLDASRGVDTTKTEMGMALGGLVTALDNTVTGRAQGSALLEVTRQLVGE